MQSRDHGSDRYSQGAPGVNVPDRQKKPLIASRVLTLGEGTITPDLLEKLEDRHLQIFMREPDPAAWPPEMEELVEYLPAAERIGIDVSRILDRHQDAIDSPLKEWTLSVMRDLGEKSDPQPVIDEMLKHLRQLLLSYLEKK
jgi:hypothetical protein